MPGLKVLVIEDNAANMELTCDLLEGAGYAVLRAETAEAGISAALAERPALILMDIALPGLEGLAATQRLKANPSTRPIPVVALTAHAMRGDEEHALAAGCAGYITKPIDTRTFVRDLECYLGHVVSHR